MSGQNHLRARIIALTSGAALAIAAAHAVADEVKEPTDPVAKAAFEVLDKSCSRCHQVGRLSARERPAKNFGNVLELDQLAANATYILPGNPYGSKLFKQIVDKEMPYDVMYEGSTNYTPTPDDIKALESWIKSLGATAVASCEQRKFISNGDMIALMAGDLDRLPRARVKGTRYLTLTNLRNACIDDNAMKVYRQGAVKLINSLSRSSDVVRLETIDPDETIIRINIDDLGWGASDWDSVLAVYSYNVQPDIKLTSIFETATGTKLPYVRADWLAFYASRPPLYTELLKVGKTFDEFSKEQGVDIAGNIKRFQAQRAGFQKSGVSQNNRLIERHPSRSGYFWTSYDFAGNRAKQSLFEFPLGPGGENGFSHDGGETIFSLPNGFQGYYLNNAKGERLDKGPTEIVRDLSRKDLAVTNGISCMGCHDQGMRKAKDEIRALVLAGRTFDRETRDAVEAMYPPHERMDRMIDDDAKRFADAVARAGLDPTLKLNGVEMINALAKRYEDDIDAQLAAASFGLTKTDFAQAAADAGRKFRPLLRRLEQGTVPFDQFETAYRDLAVDLTDNVLVDVGRGAKQEEIKQKVEEAKKVAAKTPDLSLISDKSEYKQGDSPVFTIVASKDCTLTLTDVDEKGEGTVLFPNKFQQNNKIKAGQTVTLPGPDAGFVYRMKDKGVETVIAVCAENGEADGIKHDFTRSAFTTVPNYTGSVTRAIAVVSDCKRAIAVEGTSQTSACGGVPSPQAALPAKPAAPKAQAGKPAAAAPAKPAAQPATTATATAAPESKRDTFRAAIKLTVK
jgi:hypothetical protein